MTGQKIGGFVKEVSPSAPEVVAYISTGDEDRTGEILEPGGWELAAFKKTGIVSWSHGGWGTPVAGLPIGKALDVWTDEKGLLAHVRFAVDQPEPVGSWATLIHSLIKDDLVRGWSVMFDPLGWTEPDGTEIKRKRGAGWYGPNPGRRYTSMELMEFGPQFIPANAEAATVVAKGLEGLQARGIWTPPGLVTDPGFALLRQALKADEKPAEAAGEKPNWSEAMERCVQHVMDQGHDESSAIAICTTALGDEAFRAADPEAEKLWTHGCSGRFAADGKCDSCGGIHQHIAQANVNDDLVKCLSRVDGAVLGLRVRGALSQIRRANDRMRSPLSRSDR